MLKFGKLYAKYLKHIILAYGVRQWDSSPTLNFWTPFTSPKLIQLGSWHTGRHLQVLWLGIHIFPLGGVWGD